MKEVKIETGAEMYYVDLAITHFLDSLKDDVQDKNLRGILSVILKPIKRRLEYCMTHEWEMSLGEELKLDDTDH